MKIFKEHKKNFDDWNKEKKKINANNPVLYFHEREIWWCKLGINVGYEQDGKNAQFARPVVVLKTYSTNALLIVPLTSKSKKGIYYFDVGIVDSRKAVATLSQIRFIDKRRLVNKIGYIPKETFKKLRKEIVKINLE